MNKTCCLGDINDILNYLKGDDIMQRVNLVCERVNLVWDKLNFICESANL